MTFAWSSLLRDRAWWLVALVLWGFITHGTYAGSGDEPHYLVSAHSLAFDGDLDLANNYGAAEPLIAGGTLEAGEHARPGRHGILRPVHDIGLPLLLAPYVRLAVPLTTALTTSLPSWALERARLTPSTLYRQLMSLGMIALTCLLVVKAIHYERSLSAEPARAGPMTVLLILSPPLLVFGVLVFTEILTALLLLVAFRTIVVEPRGSVADWTTAGGVTGLLLLVHARNLPLVAVLLAAAALSLARMRDPSRSRALGFTMSFALLALVRTGVTYALWGTWLTTPHARPGEWSAPMEMASTAVTRVAGMLLDQEYGVLPYAPMLLLAAAGIGPLWRRHPRAVGWGGVVVGAYVMALALPVTNAHGWTGGWSPPARFLAPLLPLMVPLLASGVARLPRRAVVAVVALQVSINVYFWNEPKNLWNDGNGVAAACERGGVPVCGVLPSFVSPGDLVQPESGDGP